MHLDLALIYFVAYFHLSKCGLDPFITGGAHTQYEKYPHAVFILIKSKFDIVCGGSVLNQQTILTAAHCLEECDYVKRTDVIVKYGHENVKKMRKTHMKKFVQHRDYDDENLTNDIGLVLTAKTIPLDTVKRVILMTNPPAIQEAYVAGWGWDENENLQNTLKHTVSTVQTLDVCKKMDWLPKGVFCAGPISGVGAADRGDSGSALMVNEYIQIGIVSYKMRGYSLVGYTNVSYFLGWIEINTKRLFCTD